MKRTNDDSREASDATAFKAPPSTDLEWMTVGPLDDCKIAAGRAPLNELMDALRAIRAKGKGKRYEAVMRAIRLRFGAAPIFALGGGK